LDAALAVGSTQGQGAVVRDHGKELRWDLKVADRLAPEYLHLGLEQFNARLLLPAEYFS